jgi:hypothetical protein
MEHPGDSSVAGSFPGGEMLTGTFSTTAADSGLQVVRIGAREDMGLVKAVKTSDS